MSQTHWNHRVMSRRSAPDPDYPDMVEYEYWIHEVYYDGEKITGFTIDGIAPMGTTIDELRSELTNMLASLDKEVIDYDAESTLDLSME